MSSMRSLLNVHAASSYTETRTKTSSGISDKSLPRIRTCRSLKEADSPFFMDYSLYVRSIIISKNWRDGERNDLVLLWTTKAIKTALPL